MKRREWLALLLGICLSWPLLAADLPDAAALAHAKVWRQQVLKAGAAGLFEQVDAPSLATAAGLTLAQQSLLPALADILSRTAPERARPYWNKTTGQWVMRLDLGPSRVNFLLLETGAKAQLAGWRDLALGVSLTQLLQAAVPLTGEQRKRFLDALADDPVTAPTLLPAGSPLARLALSACSDTACHDRLLQTLAVGKDEVSLFALEKAVAAKDFTTANRQLQVLQGLLGEDPAVVWLAGTLALAQGDCDQVVADVTPAIQRWKGEGRLYPLLSQCRMQTGQPAAALATLHEMEQNTGQRIDWTTLLANPLYAPLKPLLKR